MTQYSLHTIVTDDRLELQGMYHQAPHPTDTALLWVHGLLGTFYGNTQLFEFLTVGLDTVGVSFASFNTRGHDMISDCKKLDQSNAKGYVYSDAGAGREEFSECVSDIAAGIRFLVSQGHSRVIVLGHSTGANKVCYSIGMNQIPNVAGVILSSPMSDRLGEERSNPKLPTLLRKMRHMVQLGKGDYILNNITFFPITPKRFLSLYTKKSVEDVFDYGEKKPTMKAFSNIRVPMIVLFGELDEHADRPVCDIQRVFDRYQRAQRYQSHVIRGAPHSYDGKEREMVDHIVSWVKGL